MRRVLLAAVVSLAGCIDLDELGEIDLGARAGFDDFAAGAIPSFTWTRAGTGLPPSEVTCLAQRNGLLSAGTKYGGVWQSFDQAATWSFYGGLTEHDVASIAMGSSSNDLGAESVVYAVTSEGHVWKQDGTAWTQLSGFTGSNALSVFVDGDVLYVGTTTGLSSSTDEGSTWTPLTTSTISDAGSDAPVHVAAIASGSVVYGGGTEGVFSVNGTTVTAFDGAYDPKDVVALAAVPGLPFDTLYAAEGTGLKTTSASSGWSIVHFLGSNPVTIQSIAHTDTAVYASSKATGVYMVAPTIGNAKGPLGLNALSATPGTPGFFGGGVNGVVQSPDGVSYVARNVGLENALVTVLVADPTSENSYVATTQAGGLYRHVPSAMAPGIAWSAVSNNELQHAGVVQAIAVSVPTTTTIYAGTSLEGVWKSTDHGITFSPASTPDGGATPGPDGSVTALAVSPSSETIVYAAAPDGVYESHDAGGSWSRLDGSAPNATALLSTTSTLYVGTSTGVQIEHVDLNGQVTWSTAAGLPSEKVVTLLLKETDGAVDSLVLATVHDVYQSSDGGADWKSTSLGLPPTTIRQIALRASYNQIFYVASTNGVYQSTDGGTSWHGLNTGLDNLNAMAIGIASNGLVYVGTNGDGVYAGK